jgi:hypothetical protein
MSAFALDRDRAQLISFRDWVAQIARIHNALKGVQLGERAPLQPLAAGRRLTWRRRR